MNIEETLQETVTITVEEYNYLKLRDAQLEYCLDMIPNLDEVLEQFEYDGEE